MIAQKHEENRPAYCGRFAPSPTGPLHFGSLVAACASYLDARQAGGRWLLRIEDVDTPRNMPGAEAGILRTLEQFGFAWDGEILRQSQRQAHYAAALESLCRQGQAYPCACSRSQLAAAATQRSIDGGWVYPGSCRPGTRSGSVLEHSAWRFMVPDRRITFTDQIQGVCSQALAESVGDFVIRRSDGLFAYQLAVVVDDAASGITRVVRGADLIDSTARQIVLAQALGAIPPEYAHLPLATNAAGEKLSKQTLAAAVDPRQGSALLCRALRFLNQALPAEMDNASLADFWPEAIRRWDLARVPRVRQIVGPDE